MVSDDQEQVDWGWSRCQVWSFFGKVQCQLHEAHKESHIHDYGNGHICGWENRDDDGQ